MFRRWRAVQVCICTPNRTDSLFLDWDSIFFRRWVPGLTITVCNQNHWIYSWVQVSNFSIEKQCHPSIMLHHYCTKRLENIQVTSFSDNPKLHRYPCRFFCIAATLYLALIFFSQQIQSRLNLNLTKTVSFVSSVCCNKTYSAHVPFSSNWKKNITSLR